MTTWAVQVYRDGEPVTGQVTTDEWAVADAFGLLVVGWLGGPVSIGTAVQAHQRQEKESQTLFGHFEKECA